MARLDLTGKTFGKLYVEDFAYVKNQRTFWKCKCSCGNEVIVKGKYLTNGDTKSCGCLVYEQAYKMGKSNINRNKYEIIDDYIKVYFHNFDEYFLCDKNDLDLLKKYTWHKSNTGYVRGEVDGRLQLFHDVKLNIIPDKQLMCDHINRNRLDNRSKNLRIVDNDLNRINLSTYKNNKTGITGVCYTNDKWYAYIQKNKKRINLGTFDNFEDAKNSRLNAEKELFVNIKYEHIINQNDKIKLTNNYKSDNIKKT